MTKTKVSPEELAHAEWQLGLKDTPTPDLLEQALTLSHEDSESDDRWSVVHALRTRGDEETFAAAKNWCTSNDVTERELAADLLGQFGEQIDNDGEYKFPFVDRVAPLLEILIDDPDARVIASAVQCLGDYKNFEPILGRPALATHPSSDVRHAVACGLTGAASKLAIDTLIALTDDEDSHVRDWATFVLGAQGNLDTPEIREAFVRRFDDDDFNTRNEALVGLARRKDARVIPQIEKALRADWVGDLAIEAAGHIGARELVTALETLASGWEEEDEDLLGLALNRCKGISDPEEDWRWVQENEIIVPDWVKV